MATTWTQTRNQIVAAALRKCGAVASGSVVDTTQFKEAADMLNAMAQALQNEDIFLWTAAWATQALSASSEVTGTDNNVYTCIRAHTSATTDRPITGAKYTDYWVKRGSTGGTWAASTAYTAVNQFTLGSTIITIEDPFIRRNKKDDIALTLLSQKQYFDIVDKTTTGLPTSIWVDADSITAPTCYLYPIPDATDYVIHSKQIRRFSDINTDDTVDFPVRYMNMLIYGLAHSLSFETGLPVDERLLLEKEYIRLKKLARLNNINRQDESFLVGAY